MSTDQELDVVYDTVNDLFCEGRFKEVDEMLAAIDVDSMDSVLLIAWLTTSAWAKSKLPSRPAFYEKCETKLGKTILRWLK